MSFLLVISIFALREHASPFRSCIIHASGFAPPVLYACCFIYFTFAKNDIVVERNSKCIFHFLIFHIYKTAGSVCL